MIQNKIEKGTFLLSEPLIEDKLFSRSVICLLEHNEEGTLGLMTNKKMPYTLGQFVSIDVLHDFPVYFGGPMDTMNLFFIHKTMKLPDTNYIENGVCWNGDLDLLAEMIAQKKVSPNDIRFYLGYCGWDYGQLDMELDEKSWFFSSFESDYIFHNLSDDNLWKNAIKNLGESYNDVVFYPTESNFN